MKKWDGTKTEFIRQYPKSAAADVVRLGKVRGVALTEEYVYKTRWQDKGLARKQEPLKGKAKSGHYGGKTSAKARAAQAKKISVDALKNVIATGDAKNPFVLASGFRRAAALDQIADLGVRSNPNAEAEKRFLGLVVQLGVLRATHLLTLVQNRIGAILSDAT